MAHQQEQYSAKLDNYRLISETPTHLEVNAVQPENRGYNT